MLALAAAPALLPAVVQGSEREPSSVASRESAAHVPKGFTGTLTFFCAAASQLDRCHHFYGELLGLPLVMKTDTVRLYRTSQASFFGLTAGPARLPCPGGAILEMATSSRAEVDRLFAVLEQANMHTDGEPRATRGVEAYAFFASDPQGYLVEILHFPGLLTL